MLTINLFVDIYPMVMENIENMAVKEKKKKKKEKEKDLGSIQVNFSILNFLPRVMNFDCRQRAVS